MTDQTEPTGLTDRQTKQIDCFHLTGAFIGFLNIGFMIMTLVFLIIFITDTSRATAMDKKYDSGLCSLSDCQIIRVNEPVKVRVWLTPLNWPHLKIAQVLNLSLADAVAFCQLQNQTVNCQYNRKDPTKFCSMTFQDRPDVSGSRSTVIALGVVCLSLCGVCGLSWLIAFLLQTIYLRQQQSSPPIQVPGQTPGLTPGAYASFA